MNFPSLQYLFLFLPLVWLAAARVSRPRLRQLLLLAASYFFYFSWSREFLLILLLSSIFNLLLSRALQRRPSAWRLLAGIVGNVLLLATFKYAREFSGAGTELLVPIGISFHTFQALSFLVDSYRGFEDRPHPLEFFLYLAFWPTVLAGPICRLPELLPQFRNTHLVGSNDVREGLRRILVGLFMKLVVADTLAVGIPAGTGLDAAFGSQTLVPAGFDVLLLGVGYGLQLFFDFAGYSHMAIGSARLFGIRLRENFQRPFLATTPSEFWTRWHMSLSSWIRDYVFFPLASLRRDRLWRNLSLVVSMVVFGLWHGAAGHFLLWGAFQGLLLVIHRQLQALRLGKWFRAHAPLMPLAWLSGIPTFMAIACSWIFFRAGSLQQGWRLFGGLLRWGGSAAPSLAWQLYLLVGLVFIGWACFRIVEKWLRGHESKPWLQATTAYLAPTYYFALILAIVLLSHHAAPFVYIRF